MSYLSRKLKISILGFYGRWYLPLFAKRVPLYFVLGNIVINNKPPIPNPTQQDIDELHDKILQECEKLFNQHKYLYNWPNKDIIFI